MNIAQLIEQLQTFDPEAHVQIYDRKGSSWPKSIADVYQEGDNWFSEEKKITVVIASRYL